MADEKRSEKRGKDRDVEEPTGEGDTYNTSHQRKTGRAFEEPAKDVREKGGD